MSESSALPDMIFLMGPTAAGKTELALQLAARFPLGIVSVDSALVYRGMDIGTAKPDARTLAGAPHALIDIVDPDFSYSAACFARDARAAIETITAAGKIPLLVGGTGLYFRALAQGLSDLPASDPQIRAQLNEELHARGLAALHSQLSKIDPPAAARIHANDRQRVLRALEVFRITGKSLSSQQNRGAGNSQAGNILKIVIEPSRRSWLHQRIELRFRQMLDAGLVEEVEGLRAKWSLHPDLPSMRSVGYRQVWQFLDGQIERDCLAQRGIIATRQLAKRQLTWFRREDQVHRLDGEKPDLAEAASALIARWQCT